MANKAAVCGLIVAIAAFASPSSGQLVQPSGGALGQQQAQQPQPQVQPQQVQQLQVLTPQQAAQQPPGSQLSQLILSGAQQLAKSPLVPLAANLTATGTRYASNVLDLIKDVGKTIQQQVMSAGQQQQQQQYQVVVGDGLSAVKQPETIVVTDDKRYVQSGPSSAPVAHQTVVASVANQTSSFYREQGEFLRREIVNRAGQLQQLISSSMGSVKNNGDVIARRLLDQLNQRIDQARSKADKIISEPTNNEMAVKALATVNNGLTNINNIISNLVNRLELAGKDGQLAQSSLVGAAGSSPQRVGGAPSPPSLLNVNLSQLRQQFSAAISAVQRQQHSQQVAVQGQGPQSQPNVAKAQR